MPVVIANRCGAHAVNRNPVPANGSRRPPPTARRPPPAARRPWAQFFESASPRAVRPGTASSLWLFFWQFFLIIFWRATSKTHVAAMGLFLSSHTRIQLSVNPNLAGIPMHFHVFVVVAVGAGGVNVVR